MVGWSTNHPSRKGILPSCGGVVGKFRHGAAFLCVLLLMLGQGVIAAAEVTTTLNPQTVPAGEGATLTILITNGEVTALQPPEVPGLIFNGPNQGRQISIVNGVRTSAMTLTYAVGSMTAGDYTIPPFTLTIDGAPVQTQPLKLKVTPSANQAPAGLSPGSAATPSSSPPDPAAGEENFGFLTVEFAGKNRKHAWVGEIAPVRIKAWLPAETRVSLNTPLQPTGSSFTLHNVSNQPQQGREVLNGQRYLVVTWYGALSATKAGRYPPDLSMKISVQVPDPSGGRRSTGDPFFDQMLGRRMISKEVVLRSKTDESAYLDIRALPAEGRPADFEGAVGKFAFGRTQIPGEWTTGEPQQVACEVEGEGNFNLLVQPRLESDKEWKSYGGQSQFVPRDAASFSGTTSFRFSQVPRQAGAQEVRLTFSYFDPDKEAYQVAESPPQTVQVAGTDLLPEPEATAPETVSATPPPQSAMAPQRAGGGFTRNLTPMAWRPGFRHFLTISAIALLAGILTKSLRARTGNPDRVARAAREKALRTTLQEAGFYAARGDVPGFFAAARRALQHGLASRWQRPAPAITMADVTHRLPADSPVIPFFHEADRQEFSPAPSLGAEDLPAWHRRLEQALEGLAKD